MSDDFDDLLDAPRRRGPGRPTNAEREARRQDAVLQANQEAEIRRAGNGSTRIPLEAFQFPCSQQFLADVWGMDPATVKKRLLGKPVVVGMGSGGRPLFNFQRASQYLIKPMMSAEDFIRTLNKADLPPEVNKALWDAQRSRVKYKIEAQEAWETEDVLEVLGEVSMTIKDSLVAVVEEMRNRAKLTDEQTELLSAAIDEIRTQIREKLIEMPAKKFTGSVHSKPLFGVSDSVNEEITGQETGWLGDDDEDDEE